MPAKPDRAMIRHICNIKPVDMATVTVRSRELLAKLKLKDLGLIIRERRQTYLQYQASGYGHSNSKVKRATGKA